MPVFGLFYGSLGKNRIIYQSAHDRSLFGATHRNNRSTKVLCDVVLLDHSVHMRVLFVEATQSVSFKPRKKQIGRLGYDR